MESSETVLIVDDEEHILKAISGFFKINGIKTECFSNPEEALEKMKTTPFKTIITDIRMPKIYGTNLVLKIKEVSPLSDVIVMTGYSNMEYVVTCFENGAFDYFKKPIHDMTNLLDTVKFCIARHERWKASLF